MVYLIVSVVCILIIFYKFLNSSYDYWKKRNVPYYPPVTFFGNVKDAIIMKKSFGQIYTEIYNFYEDVPYVGIYKIRQPGLLIRDPNIIKDIMVKDFHNFAKNDMSVDEKVDPIAAKNPFFQTGQQWRTYRNQLSYCFTSGKMKHLFPLMQEVSKTMIKYLENECKIGSNPMDTKELSAKFTTDNVATCAFGLEAKSFEDPNSDFRRIGRQVLQPSFFLAVKMLIIILFPICNKAFNFKFIPTTAVNYFKDIIRSTLKYRKDNNITRNDFLDVITQMKFKPEDPIITEDDITAHAIGIFGDGFETTSITLTFTLYEIAANPEIQQKLRNEMEEVLKKHGGNLSYEAVQDMIYLDCIISESLRMHPPGLFLSKRCTTEYNLPPRNNSDDGLKVELDMPIIIPVYALHYDPKYFPNPNKFDPDRFSEENKSNVIKGTYLPFGDGPRLCIGMKFAALQVKIGLIAIVRHFNIHVNRKTKEPLEIDPKYFMLLAKGGIWLDYHKREK